MMACIVDMAYFQIIGFLKKENKQNTLWNTSIKS